MKISSTIQEFILDKISKNGCSIHLFICFSIGLICLPVVLNAETKGSSRVATSVSITSPVNNSIVAIGSSVAINVDASSLQAITLVEFFVDGLKIGEDLSSPYQFTWVATAGIHSLTATATDINNITGTSSSITLKVRNPKGGTSWPIPGKIQAENYDEGGQGLAYNDLSSGNSGAVYRTDDVDLVATTDDGGGYSVTSAQTGEWLEYSVNVTSASQYILRARVASLVGGKSFHVEMDGVNISGTVAVPATGNPQTYYPVSVYTPLLTIGQKTMRVVIDSGGFNMNNISFLFNQAPVAFIDSPVNGATYLAPAFITINASAFDVDGSVVKVEFFNGFSLMGTDYSAPYSYTWSGVPPGTYNIQVKATDEFGSSYSTSIIVYVTAANSPPSATITAPINNTSISPGSPVVINATATDNDGLVQRVEFFVIGPKPSLNKVSLHTDYTSPYSYSWTSFLTPGIYYLRVTAYDINGSSGTSSAITITIENPNQPPVISITSLSDNASVEKGKNSILAAEATDPDGTINNVEFFLDGISLGKVSSLPYEISWMPTLLGSCSITAKATDDKGAVTTSEVINLTVIEAKDPFSVVISSPGNDATFNTGQYVTIDADVFSGGVIDKVEFYIGTEKIGDDYSVPYSYSWKAKTGRHTITAKALRSVGGDAVSPEVKIYVNVLDGILDPSSKSLNLNVHPNPFGSSTTILVAMRQAGETSLIVYDLLGREIEVLSNEYLTGGEHQFIFDTKNLLSGIYIVRLVSNGMVEVRSISKE